MNFGMAISPWLFGILADSIGVIETIWICVGISFFAALVNSPLMFVKAMQPSPKKLPEYSRRLGGEDKDIVERALQGSWVPPNRLQEINCKRMKDGHHFIVMPYRSFEEDKPHLPEMRQHAEADFQYWSELMNSHLGSSCLESAEKRERLAQRGHESGTPVEERRKRAKDLGQWFADYVYDAGYQIDESPIIFKQMIMTAFPRIMKSEDQNELTAENIESVTLNFAKVYNHYHEEEEHSPAVKAFARAFA